MTTPGRTPSLPPMPQTAFQPYSEEHFVAFAYEPRPGWWRRVGAYRDLASANEVADFHNNEGKAVMVCRQVVTYSAMEPVTGASGA